MDILSTLGTVLFTSAATALKDVLIEAVGKNANLRGANLYGANLYGADLRDADLRGADLRGANLRGANLHGANLYGANLYGANLYGADLRDADLRGADLRGANLRGANLHGANLYGANLYGANLYGANLYGADLRDADLRGADLRGANLRGAENADLPIAQMSFIPEEGSFIAWKLCKNKVLIKLLIPADAKRSHGSERKCRASKVEVLEVIGSDYGVSMHDGVTEYRVGQTVVADSFNENRWEVCAPGIHFYISRLEAENHE
jgi:hypothetical protein